MLMTRDGDASLARRGGVLAGCLVALGVLVILVIAGGVFVYMNWKTWTADLAVQGVNEMLAESDLSEEQKSGIMVHVQDLADDFKAGDVSMQELAKIAEELAESPVIPVAAVYGARKAYFEQSGLTDEEKTNADLQMQRLARGVFEKKISMEELEDAVDEIAVRTSENQFQIREPDVVSDKDLREMVDKITVLVEEKEIPAEPFEVDVAKEVELAILRGRGLIEEQPAVADPELAEGDEPEAVEDVAGDDEEAAPEDAGGEDDQQGGG